jgi:hypothetical protein
LGLTPPPFTRDPFRQLEAIGNHATRLGCQSVVVEDAYVDKDFMEDYSVFYSRSLVQHGNICRRVHFFRRPIDEVQSEIERALFEISAERPPGDAVAVYSEVCRRVSAELYLGFSTIKPLRGAPVGRTVLGVSYDAPKGARVEYPSTRRYQASFAGLTWSIEGLAFQQQDVGVSACATTALWCALQKLREREEIGNPTPAQITGLATLGRLPFGRPMPSEGLSIDQMCQSLQALSVAPSLTRVEASAPEHARSCLLAAVRSGTAPILILERKQLRHAVTVVGVEFEEEAELFPIEDIMCEPATAMRAVCVHDDRVGPYTWADLTGTKVRLRLPTGHEEWSITHVLTPVHAKIRLSFPALRELALEVITSIAADPSIQPVRPITSSIFVQRSDAYLKGLYLAGGIARAQKAVLLAGGVALPRYVAIVRVSSEQIGELDVVFDSTSTRRNVMPLAVVAGASATAATDRVGLLLAQEYDGISYVSQGPI